MHAHPTGTPGLPSLLLAQSPDTRANFRITSTGTRANFRITSTSCTIRSTFCWRLRRPCGPLSHRHHTCTEAARLWPLLSTAGCTLRSLLCPIVPDVPPWPIVSDETRAAIPSRVPSRSSLTALVLLVVVSTVVQRPLLLEAAGTRCSGGGRRWA